MAEKKKYTDYKNRYNTQSYDSLRVVVPKGRKKELEARLAADGLTINGFINNLLRGYMKMTQEKWNRKEKE